MSVPTVQQKFVWIEHPTTDGIISPENDPMVMLNTSIIHPTIVGNKVCRTYEPPAKTEMRADPVSWPALTIVLDSTEISTYVIYIHDKTMTTADYGGLYGGTFMYRPTLWRQNETGSPFTEVYHIYKTEMDLLNLEEEPCNGTEGDIDFETCIRDSVEEKINCTIPDMMSGVPVAPVGRGDKPLCSTSEEYGNYSQIYQSMELTSEGDIFKDYGCLPKCQRNKYDTRFLSEITDPEEEGTGDRLTLFLFYPSGRYEKVKQQYIYVKDDFVADVGGYLGLCLGMSILTFYDAGVWLFDNVMTPMCGFDARQDDKKSKKVTEKE